MREFISSIAAIGMFAAVVPASAATVTGTGSLVMKDSYNSQTNWGRPLVLPSDGKVVRVMYGSYGFSIIDKNGNTVGDFLLPEMAMGTEIPAGEYSIVPYVCAKHRHHHVEVTVEY
ncbi:hypothetical protein [Parvibaculum sp.]|uniref:hypothetical protein n=1 Tax=Parvibaculum sp. TaxID=2024848 RepID=UPI00391B0A20